MANKDTPMMKQYFEIKSGLHDAILFFRLGDFYEMFYEDARIASRELDITLTTRNRNSPNPVPLAGIPYHSVNPYISKLVNKGYKVAICDQVEDPALAKGIVKREVVRIVTPGTVIESECLDSKSNNFLASIVFNSKKGEFLFAYCDFSTGGAITAVKWGNVRTSDFSQIVSLIIKINPSEVIYSLPEVFENRLISLSDSGVIKNIQEMENFETVKQDWKEILKDYFNMLSLEGFGIGNDDDMSDVAALIEYISENQKRKFRNFFQIKIQNEEEFLQLDPNTVQNLELTQALNPHDKGTTLLEVLDRTVSAPGGRYMKKQLVIPLRNRKMIEERLSRVGYFVENLYLREKLRELLKEFYDLERILSKLIYGSTAKRDLINLKNSLIIVNEIHSLFKDSDFPLIQEFINELHLLSNIIDLLDKGLEDDLDSQFLIRKGYDSELDHFRELMLFGKEKIIELQNKEKNETGIKTLKIKYNKVFGYFFEVTKSNLNMVPERFIRKQTLVNAERFYTQELKTIEDEITIAKEKTEQFEKEFFKQLIASVLEFKEKISEDVEIISRLDFYSALATIAVVLDYVKPEIVTDGKIDIIDGRHPVVERKLDDTDFVPNSLLLDNESEQIQIITGPNMSGKSTFIRQTAIIVLMAHIGSYVPAAKAKISICDRIFTRVGASDRLSQGLSTFMVEMTETANILNNATADSLIIFDEVGRGTSTYDGVSIAWAIVEYLHDLGGSGVKTLFATHYHELVELEKILTRVVNYNIAVSETSEGIFFLHKIERGGTDKSYGIEVAKRAGIPYDVIERAGNILKELELCNEIPSIGIETQMPTEELRLFDTKESILEKELNAIKPENMTPIEALNVLFKLKNLKSGSPRKEEMIIKSARRKRVPKKKMDDNLSLF
ncbi:DNA mismatch repair protein MutS [bacterium]|nr:DNA mismatch repair protein MutS [bacterium]